MIEFVFTIDYELYGNGTGALRDLVYEPAARLAEIFCKWDVRFVTFVEVAEFEKIEERGTDPAIDLVRRQIQDFHNRGFEIALHLHPQWCNARYEGGRWLLDASEYNLCKLPGPRIRQIVDRSLAYLRHAVNQPRFSPLSFRAGNWLFQPARTAALILAENGIRIDSSVFKGGVQHAHGLDYRKSLKHGYYWSFDSDVNEPDPSGSWTELPIYSEMVLFWRMPTQKRLGFNGGLGLSVPGVRMKVNRGLDLLRPRYPLKLDYCRMTLHELTSMVEKVIQEDRQDPATYRPLVSIGHTKDLNDLQAVDDFLLFLRRRDIAVTTFDQAYAKILAGHSAVEWSTQRPAV